MWPFKGDFFEFLMEIFFLITSHTEHGNFVIRDERGVNGERLVRRFLGLDITWKVDVV